MVRLQSRVRIASRFGTLSRTLKSISAAAPIVCAEEGARAVALLVEPGCIRSATPSYCVASLPHPVWKNRTNAAGAANGGFAVLSQLIY
jgi:hypothetical protein